MAELGIAKKLFRIGLQDTFAHGGSRDYLMKEYGIDAMSLIRTAAKALDTRLNISEKDIDNIMIGEISSDANAEAL
jgi:transketolase